MNMTFARKETLAIMVVDDDPSVNQALADHLSFRGYQVTQAQSGREALDHLQKLTQEELPKAILLDLLMPGMNGCEVLTALRANKETQNIPVIVLSILSKEEIHDHFSCGCSGYNAYVNKPFEIKQVLQELEAVLHE